jgi:hypothetical protein
MCDDRTARMSAPGPVPATPPVYPATVQRWRRPTFALAALFVLLGACSSGGSPGAQESSTTDTTLTTNGPAPAESSCQGFRGAFGTRTSTGPVAPGLLVDAVAGGVGCLDRVEFTFRSLGDNTITGQGLAPGYTVEYAADGHFTDGNVAISIQGNAFLKVTIKPASSYDTTDPAKPKPTYLGNLTLRWTQYNHLQVVRRLEDVGDTVQWVISLDGRRPFVVDAARDPTRITIWIG